MYARVALMILSENQFFPRQLQTSLLVEARSLMLMLEGGRHKVVIESGHDVMSSVYCSPDVFHRH